VVLRIEWIKKMYREWIFGVWRNNSRHQHEAPAIAQNQQNLVFLRLCLI
jgi:hypothetical protein